MIQIDRRREVSARPRSRTDVLLGSSTEPRLSDHRRVEELDPAVFLASAENEFQTLSQRRGDILRGQLEQVVRWEWYTDPALHPLPLHFHSSSYGFPLGRLMKKEPRQKSGKVLYGLDVHDRPIIERRYLKRSDLGYYEEAWLYESDRLLLYCFDYFDGAPARAAVAWLEDERVRVEAARGREGASVRFYDYDTVGRVVTIRQLAVDAAGPVAPHSTFRVDYDGNTVIRVTQHSDVPEHEVPFEVVYFER